MADETPALLELALARPREAVVVARRVLADSPNAFDASVAHHALAIVMREFGNIDRALSELRAALRLARTSRSTMRETEVLATLGVTRVFAGRTASGLASLGAAIERAAGARRGRMVFLRGGVYLILGRPHEALRDLNVAVAALREADDSVWLARALTERAFARIATGSAASPGTDLALAEKLFRDHQQDLESADAVVHRGVLALRIGDLPVALAAFDEAEGRFAELGLSDASLSDHRCAAMLAAGLPAEALGEAERAIDHIEDVGGQPAKLAELRMRSAACALAAGQPEAARDSARRAATAFSRQRRGWWLQHARLIELQATFAAEGPTGGLLRAAERCAVALEAYASPEALAARLLAGRIAAKLDLAVAGEHFAAVARHRRHGPALQRSAGWLGEALRASAAGDEPRTLHACRSGLRVLDHHRGMLGSPELQARATAHGSELAELALRIAVRSGRSHQLLRWSERWRASTLIAPQVRPHSDTALRTELAALRETISRLSAACADGRPTTVLAREHLRLERSVRARSLRASGGVPIRHNALDVRALLERLGEDNLVELVEVDERLQVVVAGRGRIRQVAAGPAAEAAKEVDIARFWLTRLAHGVTTVSPEEVLGMLDGIAKRCGDLLLGAAVDQLGPGTVVVVPSGRLHSVPWSMLPALRDRDIAVAPSASLWLRGAFAGPTDSLGGHVVLVRGPDLAERTEIEQLRQLYPEAVVLDGPSATAERVLRAMEGAALVHVAAHGTFRPDSPLFSALRLADGPLTGYDLQRLRQAPDRVVLSSCDSGLAAPAGADELLGFASSLIPLGTRSIVASIVPVADDSVQPLMVELHHALRRGAGPAHALNQARALTSTGPRSTATGWSFVALGVG
jgi:tetratricopeptide (TPR) repeat protein